MLILFGSSISFAQTIELSSLTPAEKTALVDTVQFEASGFGEAKPFTSAKKDLDAHYEFFWIFSNGNFIQNTRDTAILQRFEVPSGSGGESYKAHVYTTANYSDRGDIPPKISRDTTIPEGNPNPDPFQVTPAVTSGYLRLQYNHNNIVPNDTTVWVLSIKNPLKNNPINKFNGEVYLFFNSPVERVSTDLTTDSQVFTPIASSGKVQYAEFENIGSMVYFDSISQTFDLEYLQNGLAIDSLYQNALFWHLDNMNGEEERHIFIEFKDDPNILDKFEDTERARVKFLAFLVVDNENLTQQIALDDNESALAQQLQLDQLINRAPQQLQEDIIDDLDPDSPTTFPQFQPGFLLVDLYENEPEVAKAHDPNRMEVQACSCPPNTDGAQKLVCSVQFVNDGDIDANSIYIDIDIPEELEINSVFDTLIYLFPPIAAGELGTVNLGKGQNSIRWTLDGFAIHPADPNAEDDLSSTGKITFTILTKPGINLEDIPELQACIRFNDLDADPVCTIPVKPTPMVEDVKTDNAQTILQCDECSCPPTSIFDLPYWLLILILLLLLIFALLIYFLRRSQNQNATTQTVFPVPTGIQQDEEPIIGLSPFGSRGSVLFIQNKLNAMRYLLLLWVYFTFNQLGLAQTATECLERSTEALLAEKEEVFQQQLDSCLALFCEEDDLKGWMDANKKVARVYRDQLHQPQKALEYLYRAVDFTEFREPRNEEEWDAIGWLHINIGFTYNEYMDLSKEAVTAYEKAKQVLVGRLGIEDLLVGRYLYKPLANIYTRLGEYKAAEVLHKSYLAICSGEKDPTFLNPQEAAKSCNDLGILFWTIGQYQQAIDICQRGVGFPELSHSDQGLLYSTLARTYVDTDQYAKALHHADQAIAEFRQALAQDEHPAAKVWLANTLAMRGSIMGNLERYDDGEVAFAEAETLLKEYHSNPNNRDFGKLYANWGDLYQQRGLYANSLDYYQKSLQVMLPNFDNSDILINPTPTQLTAENTLVDAITGKAEAFAKRFQQEQNVSDLNLALDCHELVFLIETKLRQAYYYESSKLTNLEVSRHRSEKAIELALLGWTSTGDKSYQEKALAFAERSKSILLMEAFQKSNAEELAGISKELLAKEKDLQEKVDKAEKELFNARSSGADEATLQELDNQLLNDRQAYAEWVQQLEQRYPKYYNLKYNFKTASLADIRDLLSRDAAMVEYFVGQEHLYTFYISKNQFEVITTPLDFPLKDWVIDFHRNIEGYQHLSNNFEASCTEYTELGVKLYDYLMRPLESLDLADELTIIPSGILGFLSFDALLTEEPANQCHFNEYPYVVKRHNIHYGYSATLQASLQRTPKNQPDFAGFAPKFSGEGSFQALRYNRQAVEAAQSVLGGELFLGPAANIETFKAVADQFGIFHLATHAEANTEAGDFSFIVFANANGGYDSLFVRDLYGLSFQAELIVLSACETALGTIYDGEGVISLARGFLHAGARSVLTTLWSIDDVANRNMMETFYQNLHEGKSKSAALQQAKVARIEESDRRGAHPVYWAAFTAVGNMEAVYADHTWMYLSGGGIVLLLLSIFFIQRRRRKNEQRDVKKSVRQGRRAPVEA